MSGPPLTGLAWLAAATPVVLLFALVVAGRLSTTRAAAVVVATACAIALTVFAAGLDTVAVAVGKGLWLGAWILGVVWPALLLYQVASAVGLERIGRVFSALLPRREETLLLLGWLFPAFLQGVAGFGTPIAVAAPLLVAAGWAPHRAVLFPLVGYHWAVTFGSMGSSFYMASLTAHLDGAGQARFALQASTLLALSCLLSGALVLLLDGGVASLRRGARMLGVVGVPMAAALVATASVVPAIASLAAGAVGFAAVLVLSAAVRWRRRGTPVPDRAADPLPRGAPAVGGPPPVVALVSDPAPTTAPVGPTPDGERLPLAASLRTVAPYLFLIVTALPVFLVPASRAWVGEHLVVAPSFPATATGLGWETAAVRGYTPAALFGHPGTYVALAALLGAVTYRLTGLWPRERHSLLRRWVRGLPAASLPVLLLACVATVMADSGMVSVMARGVAAVTGGAYPAIAPLVGGVGSFTTGSTTTSNALFASFQHDVAALLGLDPGILLAAQTAGGNVGNALAPVVVLIGASAVGDPAAVSAILRRCVRPAAVLLAVVALVTVARAAA